MGLEPKVSADAVTNALSGNAWAVKCNLVLILGNQARANGKTPTPGEPDGRPGGKGEKPNT